MSDLSFTWLIYLFFMQVSSDLSIVDIELPFLLNYTVGSIIISYSTYAILCFFAPEVLLIIVLMIYVTILVQVIDIVITFKFL